jgi:hypothetical protein
MRWVWDKEEGEQVPEFASETQAQRILSLLMRYANAIAVTLTQAPQGTSDALLAMKRNLLAMSDGITLAGNREEENIGKKGKPRKGKKAAEAA